MTTPNFTLVDPDLERAGPYRVLIRDNVSREERWYEMEDAWYSHTMFWWTEGNFACDCNRGDSFKRAGGMSEEELDADESPCGNDRYSVLKAIFPDGSEISIDSDAPSQSQEPLS